MSLGAGLIVESCCVPELAHWAAASATRRSRPPRMILKLRAAWRFVQVRAVAARRAESGNPGLSPPKASFNPSCVQSISWRARFSLVGRSIRRPPGRQLVCSIRLSAHAQHARADRTRLEAIECVGKSIKSAAARSIETVGEINPPALKAIAYVRQLESAE